MTADWSQQLEEDLSWREGEIASLKLAIVAAVPSRRAPLLRAAWALLYAHYEGFCRFAWALGDVPAVVEAWATHAEAS